MLKRTALLDSRKTIEIKGDWKNHTWIILQNT
jgi:hypothetical protein